MDQPRCWIGSGDAKAITLPWLVILGKVIKTADRRDGKVFDEGAFPLGKDTATESSHARLGEHPPYGGQVTWHLLYLELELDSLFTM